MLSDSKRSIMGFGLTTTITRSLPARDEPPQKRRRVELEQPQPRKRGVKECLLYQVSPIVQKAVAALSFDAYHVKALAIKVIKDFLFYDMLNANNKLNRLLLYLAHASPSGNDGMKRMATLSRKTWKISRCRRVM